ncbi:signal recognition particle receptor FtsY [Companilactobacillus sp. RD055328]|uniref:signal recognition particle-docking protein FtsY n=1 Tax=Companilactobacillus sp. RD055328 TaxID=2916634 RepID=UPI001FC86B50|nr:signal recognition particle-docking protein FtsY [Companilactobacillus sp. RD055328]GKQ42578.1 signal recognition particle receptor FtsY [Companilactobacillus sp. RD055328]
MGLFDKLKKAIVGEEKPEITSEEVISEESQLDSESIVETTSEDNEPEVKSENEEIKTEIIEESQVVEELISDSDSEEVIESEVEIEKENEVVTDTEKYDEGLQKSRSNFSGRINSFLASFRSVDEDFFEDLEQTLIESDVGFETAMRISEELREEVKFQNAKSKAEVSNVIIEKLVNIYEENETDNSLNYSEDTDPTVILFVGVNGAGKTTTIGKLAHRFEQEGKKVLLAAGDTFRAGAIEQLQGWGKRINVPVVASAAHTDPASVAFDAVKKAKEENYDILLVDTAGRLQNNEGLMRELEKIKRIISRELPAAPQEVLLVLDGTTGQNAISQARQFNETTDVTGIVLTKLDGSSQGGIIFAIKNELHIPVKLVGLGEQMDDLRNFDSEKFVYGMFKDLISENN